MPSAVGRRLRAPALTAALALGLTIIPAAAGASQAGRATTTTPDTARQHAASPEHANILTAAAGHAVPGQAALTLLAQRARAAARAAAARSGGISGVVIGADGLPVAGACVTAVGPQGRVTATAAADGSFLLGGLAAGRYALEYHDCAAAGKYRVRWSGGVGWPSAAARFTVGSGEVSHVPAMMLVPVSAATAPAGQISFGRMLAHADGIGLSAAAAAKTGQIAGVVTGDGRPLREICVLASPVGGGEGYITTTGKAGTYTIRHLPAGRYDVGFAGAFCPSASNWLAQAYRDDNSPFAAYGGNGGTAVKVASAKATRGIDARLRLGGEISGTVTTKSGRKLGGICVNSNGTVPGGQIGFQVQTAGNGSYHLHALFPGRYALEFTTGCGTRGNYAPASRRAIKIKYGQDVSGVNAALGAGASVTGTVRLGSNSGPPLAGMCVAASNYDGSVSSSATTGASGSYRVVGLGTGTYQLQISPGCTNDGNYTSTILTTHTMQGKVTSGADAVLQTGAEVSGVVTDARDKPVPGICTDLQGGGADAGIALDSGGETGPDGSYLINGLPAGTYELSFLAGCGNSGSYAPYWYDGQTDESLATPIVLATAASVTVNAQLQPGATISGKVTGGNGRGLSGICVYAATQAQAELGAVFETETQTTGDGNYSIPDLAPGQYLVDFGCGQGGSYADQWFDSAPNAGDAVLVSAGAGRTSGISAVLRPGGSISGVVTGTSGRPLAGVCVAAISTKDNAAQVSNAPPVTNSRGQYGISGLPAGSYDVNFSPCDGSARYAEQWYGGQASPLSSTAVRVRSGKTTSGIDARLIIGGTISGRVVSGAGKPLRNICVEVFDETTDSFGFTSTGKSGAYTVAGLSSGRYTTVIGPCGNQNLVSMLKHARVRAPHATTGIDATLLPGGSVAGVVTAAEAKVPVSNACVEIISADPDNPGGFAGTGSDGSYVATGLAAGNYQVYFGDPECGLSPELAPQWYDNQPTQATAGIVAVTVGQTTPSIDATLQSDGEITGTVSGPSATAIEGICVTATPVPQGGATPVVAVSGTSGSYTLADLVPGQYTLRFSAGCGARGYATQWWQDATSRATASVISVAADQDVSGKNATLAR